MKNGLNKQQKKIRKGRLKKFELKANLLTFGTIGLKTIESGILNLKQLETTKQTILKITKQKVKIWLKSFEKLPIFTKSIGIRMGKGKGKFSHYVYRIKAGTILFELCGSNKNLITKSLIISKMRLPVKTKICFKIIFG